MSSTHTTYKSYILEMMLNSGGGFIFLSLSHSYFWMKEIKLAVSKKKYILLIDKWVISCLIKSDSDDDDYILTFLFDLSWVK